MGKKTIIKYNMKRIIEVIYVGDPMCTWCWGIAGEFTRFRKEFDGKIEFKLVMGGIRALENAIPLETLKVNLRNSWKNAAQETGQPFNMDFFDREDFFYDSEPACRAVVTVREMDSEKAFAFKEKLESAFYRDNQDPTIIETYIPILEELALSVGEFREKFGSEEMKQKTIEDFELSDTLDVRGFPTLLVSDGVESVFFCKGYATMEQMRLMLDEINKGHLIQIDSAVCDINTKDC